MALGALFSSYGCGNDESGGSAEQPGEILFATNRLGRPQIFSMNSDGSDPRLVWLDPIGNDEPSWSPDRSEFVFTRRVDKFSAQLWIVDSYGQDAIPLTVADAQSRSEMPDWSSARDLIVYASNKDAPPAGIVSAEDLYVIDPSGSGTPVRLTFGNEHIRLSPSWSSDGNRIAYASCDCSGEPVLANCFNQCDKRRGVWNIFSLDFEGGESTQLTFGDQKDIQPDFSEAPGDDRVVFSSNRVDDVYQIFVMDGQGGGLQQLTDGVLDSTAPTWSPDGTQILYTSGSQVETFQIYVMNADGSNKRQLTSTSNGTDAVGGSW